MNYEIFQLINSLAGTYTWLDTSMIYIVKYLSIVFALLLILLSGLGLYFKDKRLIKKINKNIEVINIENVEAINTLVI